MLVWLEVFTQTWFWREVLWTLVILFSGWVAAQAYVVVVDKVFRPWAARTASQLDDRIVALIRRPGFFLILLVGIYAALHRYRFSLLKFLDGILFVFGVAIVIYTIIKITAAFLAWYGEKFSRETGGDTVARELLPLADKFANLLYVVVGLVVVLDHFSIDIKSILVTLGVGSLAIGLALQDTLANMFGGFTIMIDRRFRIGDRIRLQSGESGDVQSIGIRSTTVLTPDGNVLIIPNAILVKTIVFNLSSPDARAQLVVEVGVAHGTDTERVKKLMQEAAREHPQVLSDPAPAVFLSTIAPNALNLKMYCFVRNFVDTGSTNDSLISSISGKFRASGIEVPYPTQRILLEQTRPE